MQQIIVSSGPVATQLVWSNTNNPSPILISNTDPNNTTVYVGKSNTLLWNDPNSVAPLAPGQNIVATGGDDIYAVTQPGQSAQVTLYSGITSFFQPITTLVIQGQQAALLIYSPAPGLGTLIGSWAAQAFTDQFGNSVPQGINVNQGQLFGVLLSSPTIVGAFIQNALISAPSVQQPSVTGGTMTETTITFDSTGGMLLVYSTTTTTTTFNTGGVTTWTAPLNASVADVKVWGADAGAGGGNSSIGGEGGGAGEFAEEPNYPIVGGNVYQVVVGGGGTGGTTGTAGSQGGGSSFDNGNVFAQGGLAGSNFVGGLGGNQSTNTRHFPGGNGGGDGTQSTGGCGGGGRAGSTGPGGNGAKSTSSSGAVGGTAGTGTGGLAGGNGGNAAANGNNGGGGGGCGAANQATQGSNQYRLSASATYFGSDAASGAPPNGKRLTGTMYQGGETEGGGSFNGVMKSLGIISGNPSSDLAGKTIDSVTIRLEWLHTWFNSGGDIALGYNNRTSLPSSWNAADITSVLTWSQGSVGSPVTTSLTNHGLGSALQSGAAKAITIGPGPGSISNPNLNYYGYIYGAGGDNNQNPLITVNWHTGSAPVQAGNGADGMVSITVTTASQLVLSASPIATTDQFGNSIPAGFAELNPDGSYNRIRTESTDNTGSTANTLAFIQVTKSWNVPASDLIKAGSGYRLKAWGTGTWPAVAGSLNIRGNFTGAGGLGAIAIGASEFALSTAFKWYMETTIIVTGTGASAGYTSYSILTLAAASGNQLTTTGAQAAGAFTSTGGAVSGINTTAAATMWIEAEWSTNAGSLTCVGSTFHPIGP